MYSSPSIWLTDPEQAHAQWRQGLVVAERAYAEHSQRLYASLFGRFCAWLRTQERSGQRLTLLTVEAPDIGRFLDELKGRADKPASARTKRTYLAEIDRVLRHLQGHDLRQDNPALGLLEQARVIAPLKPRNIHLPAVDMPQRFHAMLRALDGQDVSAPQLQSIAMALIMLECGLTLKELQKLLVSHVVLDEQGVRLKAPGHRTIMPRVIDLGEATALWLRRWLQARSRLKIVSRHDYTDLSRSLHNRGYRWDERAAGGLTKKPRPALFVSFAGRTAKEGQEDRGMRALGLAIDRLGEEAIFQAAEDAVFAQRDIEPEERKTVRHKGPQALRNLCCARLMAAGRPASEIAELLGLRRNDQVWAMGRQLRLDASAQGAGR